MTPIASRGFGLHDPMAASRVAYPTPTTVWAKPPSDPAVTRVTLGQRNDLGAVYSDPRVSAGVRRAWSAPVGPEDNVSALMARNRNLNSYSLNDQWRGLGGALLTGFANSGTAFSQTLVDQNLHFDEVDIDALSEAERTQRAADITLQQAAALADVADHVPTASFKVMTRSGLSVELQIAVNSGIGQDDHLGMKVKLKASGKMNAEERAAIEQLANGLDRALEGLGRDDAVELNLSGLTNYDRSVLSSVDLTANNTQTHQALRSFALHLGDDTQSIKLDGSDGEMNLSVDVGGPFANIAGQQRGAAIQRALDRFDSAGTRGNANRALIDQTKSAFGQMQGAFGMEEGADKEGPEAGPATSGAAADRSPLRLIPTTTATGQADTDAEVASRLSGLADFEATFGGEMRRSNGAGTVRSAGHADYELSQKTTTKDLGGSKASTSQTVTENLSAEFKTATGAHAMLDVRNGNYSTTRVRDASQVTTLIDSATDGVTRVLRKTDEQRFKGVIDLQNHREVNRQSRPEQTRLLERLR